MKWILLFSSILVVGCSTAPPAPPPPEPRKVVVTNTAPSNAVVERSVARVEARVAETSSKVDEVSTSVSAAVERAVRANDSVLVVEMRQIEAQVDELRIGLKLAEAESESMAEEVAATKTLFESVTLERDEARMAEAKATLAHETAEKAYAVNIEHQKGITSIEKARGDKAVGVAWKLSIVLGIIVLAGIVFLTIKLYR